MILLTFVPKLDSDRTRCIALLSQHIFECPSPFYSSDWQTAEEPKDKEEPKKEGADAVAVKKEAPAAGGGGGKKSKGKKR